MFGRALLGCALIASAGLSANASVVFNLNHEFSGGTAPSGSGPWLTLTFTQNGANNVRLTVESLTTANEFTTNILFNIATTYVPTNVGFAFNSGLSSAGTTPDALLRKAANPLADASFKADGDGYFDFRIDYSGIGAFNGGEHLVFDLSAAGLLESHFNFDSEPGGGNGSYHAAAHVQNTPNGGSGSGWIGDGPTVIPLPPAVYSGAASLALASLVVARRRRII